MYRCLRPDLAGLHVHLDVGDDADLARGEDAEAEAAARAGCSRSAGSSSATFGFQPAAMRRTVEHREPACAGRRRRVDVLPAERDRVHVRRVRELVDDLLAGEELLRCARRPEEVALEGAAVERLRLREHPARPSCSAVRACTACPSGRDRRCPALPATSAVARAAAWSGRCCSGPGRRSVQSAATILPLASAPILTSHRFAMPQWSQPCWSQRIHCTRTGLPSLVESDGCLLVDLTGLAAAERARALVPDDAEFAAGIVPPVTQLIDAGEVRREAGERLRLHVHRRPVRRRR